MFRPQAYFSQSNDDVDITDSHLTLTVSAKPGWLLDEISLQESGDFTLIGLPGVFASASVATPTTVTVITPTGPVQLFANMIFEQAIPAPPTPVFVPSSGTFSLPGDATSGTFWRGHLSLSLAGYNATQAYLSLDDVLSTLSAAGSAAKIEKKSFDVTATTVVPEPATLALLGAGLVGLAVIGWRKR